MDSDSASVITGGGGGMRVGDGVILGTAHTVLLCDMDQDRLDVAVEWLAPPA